MLPERVAFGGTETSAGTVSEVAAWGPHLTPLALGPT